jgi:hypothetical protein
MIDIPGVVSVWLFRCPTCKAKPFDACMEESELIGRHARGPHQTRIDRMNRWMRAARKIGKRGKAR